MRRNRTRATRLVAMDARTLFVLGVVVLAGVQRLFELWTSKTHLARRGGKGTSADPAGNWALLVLAQGGWLAGTTIELLLRGRPARAPLFWTGLALFALGDLLRQWCMRALGPEWNARAVVSDELQIVTRGPYRWMRHPNYLGVMLELVGLCVAAGAWITLSLAGTAQVLMLARRMQREDELLFALPGYREAMEGKGGFLPRLTRRRARAGSLPAGSLEERR